MRPLTACRSVSCPAFPYLKSNFPFLRLRRRKQLFYCIKNHLELIIVLLFHFLNFLLQFFMSCQHLSDFGKSPHYLNVYLNALLLLRTLESIATPFSQFLFLYHIIYLKDLLCVFYCKSCLFLGEKFYTIF